MEDDLIRFPCGGCGKIVGADPEMQFVVCSGCQAENEVPSRRSADEAAARSGTVAVRIVSIDIPPGNLVRLGLAVAVAATPLLLLTAIVAITAVWVASRIP